MTRGAPATEVHISDADNADVSCYHPSCVVRRYADEERTLALPLTPELRALACQDEDLFA